MLSYFCITIFIIFALITIYLCVKVALPSIMVGDKRPLIFCGILLLFIASFGYLITLMNLNPFMEISKDKAPQGLPYFENQPNFNFHKYWLH
ncbi:hypothetical protein OFO01_07380 [Campylobacter sp. JMF_01 NE2]|uniref:hypothetical protein n=1 Tax=unclassified Campylobacter TaxID=2593542 RepID=UPI0022E9B4C7|nr:MULTISPECIES: hypothetical protein [unclassified Campylobacter]MDA3053214.1 hypothetical protein [Campylobacter sp. JMF_03 NE3]MDA3067603.1 hypothetical protein [Campylobacter sp. JMF_01 NE2]